MNNPTKSAALVADLLNRIKAHPMCLTITDKDGYYLVIYPSGDFRVGGVRVSQGMGKAKALARMLVRMESDWNASFPQPRVTANTHVLDAIARVELAEYRSWGRVTA